MDSRFRGNDDQGIKQASLGLAWERATHFTIPIAETFTAAIYVIDGAIEFPGGQTAKARHLCLLAKDGPDASIHAAPGTIALLLAGETIGAAVASYGPSVMNTCVEIMQAVNDFQSGNKGRL